MEVVTRHPTFLLFQ